MDQLEEAKDSQIHIPWVDDAWDFVDLLDLLVTVSLRRLPAFLTAARALDAEERCDVPELTSEDDCFDFFFWEEGQFEILLAWALITRDTERKRRRTSF